MSEVQFLNKKWKCFELSLTDGHRSYWHVCQNRETSLLIWNKYSSHEKMEMDIHTLTDSFTQTHTHTHTHAFSKTFQVEVFWTVAPCSVETTPPWNP